MHKPQSKVGSRDRPFANVQGSPKTVELGRGMTANLLQKHGSCSSGEVSSPFAIGSTALGKSIRCRLPAGVRRVLALFIYAFNDDQ
jgi:hypothetical protein